MSATVTMDGLVADLLRLEPDALVILGGDAPTERDIELGMRSRIGLNALLRQILTLALALRPDPAATIRLHTEATARAAGWPDSRTANFAMVLTWGALEGRYFFGWRPRGWPAVPLLSAREDCDPHGSAQPPSMLRPSESLVKDCRFPSFIGFDSDDEPSSPDPQAATEAVVSTNAVIREVLGLEPRILASSVGGIDDPPDTLYGRDPEGAGRIGLKHLLNNALVRTAFMPSYREQARLMGENDAADGGHPDARSVNVAMLLASGLVSENDREVVFLPERSFSKAREDLLAALAMEVVASGSTNAFDGFWMVWKDAVHVGPTGRLGTKWDRLIKQATIGSGALNAPAQLEAAERGATADG